MAIGLNTSRTKAGAVAVLGVVAAIVTGDQLRMVWSTNRSLVNSDGSLLWYTAREFGHFRFHQPNFYGQSYGTPFEGGFIEIAHRLGVGYSTATALVLLALFVGAWLALAVAVWPRHFGLALAAVAAPMVLSSYHTLFVTLQPVSPTPRILAVLGVALFIRGASRAWVETAAWVLVAFALVTDASTSVLTVPVVLWFVIDQGVTRVRLRAAGIGGLVALAWLIGCRIFYTRHPDNAFHPSVSLRPRLSILRRSLAHADRLFSLYSPEVWRWWAVPVAALVVLVAWLCATRELRFVAPAVAVAMIVLIAMATPRAEDQVGVWLPAGRILLALPFAAWFLAFLVAESGVRARGAVIGFVALALLGATVRVASFDGRVLAQRDKIVESSNAFGFPIERSRVVAERCARARATGTDIAVFVTDIKMAYACSALDNGTATLTPTFERRTWVLYDVARRTRSSAALWNVDPSFCEQASAKVATCRMVASDAAVITFAPQPLLPVLKALGIALRVFGPDCHPRGPYALRTCSHPYPS